MANVTKQDRAVQAWRPRAWIMAGMLWLASAAAMAGGSASSAPVLPCETGSYRLQDGRALDIGPGEPGQLRWRLADGRTGALAPRGGGRWSSTLGWTGRPDGHVVVLPRCGQGTIRFDGVAGRRVPLVEFDTRFAGSGGIELAGRLTLPAGDARVPLVVLVHGAEHTSALQRYSLQREFAAAGIGVFAYDKRGTGASGGRYTQDYLTLAVDAIHAAREARRLAGARAGRIGYQGGSQGGWVAPLAATIEPVDFMIVSFGLAVSPLDEDREAIAADIARAGYGADVEAQAMEIADAVAEVVGSGFRDGYARLAAVKAKYAQAPWYGAVRGNIAGYLLATPPDTIRAEGPKLLAGVPAYYDPMPVLANLRVPQLWLLGGEDRDAPPGETLRRLARLQAGGRPITTALFPHAEHGMYEFEPGADGERLSTRQPDGYFRIMRDFIRGDALDSDYGGARIGKAR
ncbi:MAG TPA: alpha/beta hydrolase [Xanthomonadaceae bacterium]|nr:alpha/beta hydrolase [Xanthomonadaceae bacterium]